MEFLFFFLIYAYTAYCLQVIARKTYTPNAWWAWIPLLNIFLLVKIAGKSYWWVLWSLIPLVNIVITVIVWTEVAHRLKKWKLHGVLMLIPVVNWIVIGYLAFSSEYQKPLQETAQSEVLVQG